MIIYYRTDVGTATARPIYGLSTQIKPVPASVARLDVDAPPAGCEFTHVVDTTQIPMALVADPALAARQNAEADAVLDMKHLKALALALSNQTLGGIANPNGLTPAQLRTRFLAAWRSL
jgi:hypothetical protein